MDSNIIEWLNLVVRWIHVIKGIFSRPNGIWRRVDGFDFTVLKYRKIKTFQGNIFNVSSAIIIKL